MERAIKPEINVVSDSDALYHAGADEFVHCAQDAIARSQRFCVALSGGNTPRGVHSVLAANAKASLPWNQIYIFFGDERHVPPNDPESNYRMARESLIEKVPLPEGNVHRIHAELPAQQA